jgi:DNA-directed RNA polymerase subunit RPC12/RpoP
MAWYKYEKYLKKKSLESFDEEHKPSVETPRHGIYRCMGCGREIVSEQGKPLPPQNHHQHTEDQRKIRWKLIVRATHNQEPPNE